MARILSISQDARFTSRKSHVDVGQRPILAGISQRGFVASRPIEIGLRLKPCHVAPIPENLLAARRYQDFVVHMKSRPLQYKLES